MNEITEKKVNWKVWIGVMVIIVGALIILGGPASTSTIASNGVFKISVIAAFFGGVLSLLSPCSAAMLPAFFAYSFKERTELVKMTFIFWLGLATLFVPLGFSASLISKLFITQSAVLFYIAGGIFILLGILSFTGKTLTFGISAPTYNKKRPVGTVYTMGVLFAFASGTCAAPIIGGIFTLAATQGQSLNAVLLLTVYSLGLVVPLLLLAWFFDKKNFAQSSLVRGKEFSFGTWRIHSTKLITGIIFILIGILFITTKGTNSLVSHFGGSGLTDIYFNLNQSLLHFTHNIPGTVGWGALALIVLAGYAIRRRSHKQKTSLPEQTTYDDSSDSAA